MSVFMGSVKASLVLTGLFMVIFLLSQTKKNELGMFLHLILYIGGMLSIGVEAEVKGVKENGDSVVFGTTLIVVSLIYAIYRHRKFTQEKLAEYDKGAIR